MSLWSFLLLLLIAAVTGALGQAFAGYDLGGCLVSIVVGFLGALVGTWVADFFGLGAFLVVNVGGVGFPVVWAVLGSALLVVALGVLRGLGRRA